MEASLEAAWTKTGVSGAHSVLDLLKGGDRRSNRGADEAVAMVSGNPTLFAELIEGMWHEDRLVRMRAADAAEKISRMSSAPLTPHKKALLGLMSEAREPELRWHLAVMIPRLPLKAKERQFAASALERYLEDRSSIVRTFALQGLADLARHDVSMRAVVIELLRQSTRTGTPAMKARSRKLLLHLEEV